MKDSLQQAKEKKRLIKLEWADLWANKYEDAKKAEGISVKDYDILFVESGEVIHATRTFKPLSFHEILEKHIRKEDISKLDIDPNVGGWKKFSKHYFPPKQKNVNREKPKIKNDLRQHQRKGGAGWRNQIRIIKKKKENYELDN